MSNDADQTGRSPRGPFDDPVQASAVEGEVVITGPEHLHGAFSPKAARRSAKILDSLADEAEAGEPGHESD